MQIFEPAHGGGHPTNYIEALLPPLVDLRNTGQVSRVIVTISDDHRESKAFHDQLAIFEGLVEFDSSMPTLWGLRNSVAIARNFLAFRERYQSDYVIATTADLLSIGLCAEQLRGHSLPERVHSIGIFHKSYGQFVEKRNQVSFSSARVLEVIYSFGRRFANWSEVQVVNPLAYPEIKRRSHDARKVGMLPDPVEPLRKIDRVEARLSLGIPVDGRYVGCVGSSDKRKAIPELLRAFRAAATHAEERLLLAGRLYGPYKELINRVYSDLLDEGRLIIIDHYLTKAELAICLSAIDVASYVFYPGTGLSASLLAAALSGTPVLAGDSGYSGAVTRYFKLGWSCNVFDEKAFADSIRSAFDQADSFQSSAETSRLASFHDPANYANAILKNLYARLGLPARDTASWDWELPVSSP